MDKPRIGVAGIGKISEIYLKNLTGMFARRVAVSAVTDVVFERAEKAAAQYGLRAADPNTFGGPVRVKRFRAEDWSEIPLMSEFTANSRGLGITDMAESISGDRPHRASGELACHVLEIMHGIHGASASKSSYHLKTSCERPAAFLGIP
jgi:predicted dehydrogenase